MRCPLAALPCLLVVSSVVLGDDVELASEIADAMLAAHRDLLTANYTYEKQVRVDVGEGWAVAEECEHLLSADSSNLDRRSKPDGRIEARVAKGGRVYNVRSSGGAESTLKRVDEKATKPVPFSSGTVCDLLTNAAFDRFRTRWPESKETSLPYMMRVGAVRITSARPLPSGLVRVEYGHFTPRKVTPEKRHGEGYFIADPERGWVVHEGEWRGSRVYRFTAEGQKGTGRYYEID